MSSFTECEGEACWAAGWLQHSITISSNISAQTMQMIGEGLEGPLTTEMSPDSFPKRVVPLDATVLSVLFILIGFTVLHEIYASYRKPILANHDQAASNWVQMTYLSSWFQMFLTIAMTVPVSLDFSLQMGQSAAMSGFFLSSPIFGSIVGIIIGRCITSETNWNQRFARRLLVFSGLFSNLSTLTIALVINHASEQTLARRHGTFWLAILLLQVATIIASMPTVPMLVMQNKLTPTSEKTFWMIMAQCARNGGMLIGPGFFALVASAVKQGQPMAPASLLSWVYLAFLIFGSVLTNYQSWVLPTVLVDLPEEPPVAEAEACVTLLPPTQRERVVKNMVWYALERPFSISAIEVGTIMLLEVSYGWSTELCGTAFTVVAGTSLIFSFISGIMLSRGALSESGVFFGANCCALIGVIFLFDFGTGPAGLLVADGMVYGMASVANGIAEGWASKAAMPNTGFSLEIYRLQNTLAVNLARFTSPILTRTLLDFGGRNVYACLQLLVVFLGTMTVYRTVRLVWDNKGTGSTDPKKPVDDKAMMKEVLNGETNSEANQDSN